MKTIITILFLVFLPLNLTAAQSTFSQQKLDQIMAPVALYPDVLLSQILMASTYPEQVKEAVVWSQHNTHLKGEDAVKAVKYKNWDPSVASLTAFPQVLRMMGQKPTWVENMGNAFLTDSDRVMDTIQHLRIKAKNAGHLTSSQQQIVKTRYDDGVETIIIEPASQAVLYVPVYNPVYIYGVWPYPAFMPFVYYPLYYPVRSGFFFSFSTGIIVGNIMWSNFNWYHHDIAINTYRYNAFYRHRQIHSNSRTISWRHTMRPKHPRTLQRTTTQRQRDLQYKRDLQYQRDLKHKRDLQRKNAYDTMQHKLIRTQPKAQDRARVKQETREKRTYKDTAKVRELDKRRSTQKSYDSKDKSYRSNDKKDFGGGGMHQR